MRLAALTLALSALLAGPVVAATPLAPEVAEIRNLLREGKVDDAVERGEALVEQRPEDGKAWLWLGNAYGRSALEAGLLTKASWAGKCRDAYEKAVALLPQDPDARFSLMQYYAQAPGFLGGGEDKAREQVEALAKIGPAWGHMGRAALLSREDKDDEAVAAYVAAVEADPANYRATLGLISMHLGAKRYPQARGVAEKALARDAADPVGLYMVGRIAVDDGQHIEDGVRSLDAYIALAERPEELSLAAAWWRKGLLLEKLGRKAEAVEALRRSVSLDGRLEPARKDLERLEA
jgi:tetratricopeptide (TPR) repeat protein